jgi:large subunit ribosomal protein L18
MTEVERKLKQERRERRHRRVRSRIRGTAERPRLAVFRSDKRFWAQLVNDDERRTLVGMTDASASVQTTAGTKTERAFVLGKRMAEEAQKQNVTRVVFDRGGFRFHGRIKRFVEGAREGGLQF